MTSDRLKEIYKTSGYSVPHISNVSGIPVSVWRNAIYGRNRVNDELITAVDEIWPQYVYWLVTGRTLPECGQISPEDERLRLAKQALDRDARRRNKND